MAAQLGLLSTSNHHLKYLIESHQQLHPPPVGPPIASASATATATAAGYWMWNPKIAATAAADDNEDSWEIRAFEEDTGNNATWPPRSYMCTFCRREFRSAQALGGHMNVHRRDRARLHQAPPSATSSPGGLIFPSREIVANGGLCVLYSLPNPNSTTTGAVFSPAVAESCNVNPPPPTLLSISPFSAATTTQFLTEPSLKSPVRSSHNSNNICDENDRFKERISTIVEDDLEVDLELRLGFRSSSSSSST